MTKKVAVINDISGFGRCSLTAAIPVLSVLGITPCPVPSAVLTGQTGYEHHFCMDMTETIPAYITNWKMNEVSFEGIYTGYMTGSKQLKLVEEFVSAFKTPDTFLLVDPVMGDDGRCYKMFSKELLEGMKHLVKQADMITPNLMEACLLTGHSYEEFLNLATSELLMEKVVALAKELRNNHHTDQKIVITGVKSYHDKNLPKVINVALDGRNDYASVMPYLDRGFSGTGDLFASCMCGMTMQGVPLDVAMERTGKFLFTGIQDAIIEEIPSNDGICFEKHLGMLLG